jgi:hypothetical protein
MGNYSGYVKLHWKKYHMSLIYRYVILLLSQFITPHIYLRLKYSTLYNRWFYTFEEYRAAIGMFHFHTCNRLCGPFVIRTDTYLNIFRTNLRCSLFFVCLLLLQDLNPNVNALFLLFTLHFILLVGNIESNPGHSILTFYQAK